VLSIRCRDEVRSCDLDCQKLPRRPAVFDHRGQFTIQPMRFKLGNDLVRTVRGQTTDCLESRARGDAFHQSVRREGVDLHYVTIWK
jgi:hypothetical protein